PLLFVMFGVNKAGAVQNRFGVLDTDEWKWVDQYNSPYPPQDESDGSNGPSGSSSNGSLSSGAIAGIVVGCVAGVLGEVLVASSQDASNVIPNATLFPLLPVETAPPYRGNIPNEVDPPIVLSGENIINGQAVPRHKIVGL
ncbi:hypothetical protein INT45_013562, partial [Circinella minor]